MPLGILNNIPSLAAENQLTLTNNALQTTLQQLSSGSRINTGADDAAGLAIANGLQANVTALTQSVSNANNGVGELQLADGALAQVTTLLNRAITLATESATGTVSNAQRTALQAEYSSILAEINRVGSSTTYNGQQVFQNGSAPNLNAQNAPTGSSGALALGDVLTVGQSTSITSGGTTFTYTAAPTQGANLNEVTSANTGLTASTVIASGTIYTSTRASGTTIYTATAATTVGELETAINTGAATAHFTVTGTDASHTGYQATLTPAGALQVTDLHNNNDEALVETVHATTGAFSANAAATSTVQDLINAINSDTTVGAKAALVNGVLQITDPQDRNNIVAKTTDTILGAAVAGAPTTFTTPNTTGVAVTNLNQLVGNVAGLTTATTLGANAVYSFDAGGKSFTYTANAGNTNTIGDLLSAINNPATDPAGLTAYLNSAGNLVITDPNNSSNIKVDSTNTETVAGTFTNPSSTSIAAPTNIFLSDATAVGSSQIQVQIGALNTGGITNGSGGNSVNLNAAGADITTQGNAQSTLTLISAAIANIASVRGTLGASVNRLTAASNVINSQVQNLTSAENTITAADIPAAVASLTKYSILEQTGIAALAQANQQQQLVLKLLG
ncbi:MAG TPA: flagellin [Candidatus Solibacter sp.]|nr:flagellin [Candidatus Solibacter sp.]